MIIIMRHGPWDHQNDCLKNEGWEEAKEVAENLPAVKKIIVSPKNRCQETAFALGFTKFEIDQKLNEMFPDEVIEFRRLSKEIGAFEALFSKQGWRKVFEEKIFSLLSWIFSLKNNTLLITHGEVLCGLSLASEGKRNWKELEWKNHLFRPFAFLEVPSKEKENREEVRQ